MMQLKQKSNSPRDSSQLTGHKKKTFTKGSLVHIFCILYFDDEAFTFIDHAQLVKGLQLIYSQFGKFGLEMHISQGKKSTKTKYVFFPPPGLFGRNAIQVETGGVQYTIEVKVKSKSHEKM